MSAPENWTPTFRKHRLVVCACF